MPFMEKLRKIFGLETYVCVLTALILFPHLILFSSTLLCNLCNVVIYTWGVPIILYHLIKEKPFLPSHRQCILFYLIAAFFVFSFVSIAVNYHTNLVENLSSWYSGGLQIFVCCFCIASAPKERAKKLFSNIILSTVALTMPIAIASLVLQLLNIRPLEAQTSRFTGLFYNPNSCYICAVSLILGFLYWIIYKKKKKLMIANGLLQASLIGLSESRALFVMMGVILVLTAAVYAFIRYGRQLKKAALSFVAVLLVCLVCFEGVTLFGRYLPQAGSVIKNSISSILSPNNPSGEEPPKITPPNREESNKEASNSFRITLLVSGLKTFSMHPIFGVGPRNIADKVREAVPEEDLNGIDGGGLHNMYVQLLVGVGIGGFLLFVLLAVYVILSFIRTLKYQKKKKEPWEPAMLYCFVMMLGICSYQLFEANFMFANTLVSIGFWSIAGFLMNRISQQLPSMPWKKSPKPITQEELN